MERLQNSTLQLQLFLRLSFLLITKKNQKNYFSIQRLSEVKFIVKLSLPSCHIVLKNIYLQSE